MGDKFFKDDIERAARERAHDALMDKVSCWEPGISLCEGLSHDWVCDAVADAIEEPLRQINTPEIVDFAKAIQLEAAHQRSRWGSEHDAGKTDADWFWLIGYLGGKALRADDGIEKQLHRIITVAAAACNWHAAKLGQTNMRPGIETPAGEEEPGKVAAEGAGR